MGNAVDQFPGALAEHRDSDRCAESGWVERAGALVGVEDPLRLRRLAALAWGVGLSVVGYLWARAVFNKA